MLQGVPGTAGCMVVTYVCVECECVPAVDLNWSVTKGPGQGRASRDSSENSTLVGQPTGALNGLPGPHDTPTV